MQAWSFALSAATALLLVSTALLTLGHYFRRQRLREMGGAYEQFNADQDYAHSLVCVMDVESCHWSYLLERELWGSMRALQLLE